MWGIVYLNPLLLSTPEDFGVLNKTYSVMNVFFECLVFIRVTKPSVILLHNRVTRCCSLL